MRDTQRYAAMCYSDFEEPPAEAEERLRRLYRELGFWKIPKSDLMARSLVDRHTLNE